MTERRQIDTDKLREDMAQVVRETPGAADANEWLVADNMLDYLSRTKIVQGHTRITSNRPDRKPWYNDGDKVAGAATTLVVLTLVAALCLGIIRAVIWILW